MEHQEIKGLLPLAAFDRLEGDEASALREHLRAGCDECEAEMRSYREVAAALASAIEPVGSEEHIMERLKGRLAGAGASLTREQASRRGDYFTRAALLGQRGWRIACGISAAAFIVVTAFAGFLVHYSARAHVEFEQQTAKLEAQRRELRSKLTLSQDQVDALERVLDKRAQLDQILLAPDLRLTRLEPPTPGAEGVGLVVVSTANHAALIQVSGLPQTPAAKTYELW